MTQNNREYLQKAIGIIEGISYCASTNVRDALCTACEILDSISDDEAEESEDKNAKAEF